MKDHSHWHLKYWAGSQFTKSGIPDILACVNGYFVAIEVKALNGKPSELQKYNVRLINEGNGFAVVVRPDQWDNLQKMLQYLVDDDVWAAENICDEINSLWNI